MKYIETSELRVGNILYYKNTVDIAIVELIHKNNFDCRDINGSFTPNGNYEPIPLTEEWLVKAGEDLGYTIVIKCNRKKIVFEWGSKVVSTGKRSSWRCYKYRHIKYVHQLQNLYFALTGIELTLK